MGNNVYKKIKPDVIIVHQHRCGLQIGFYDDEKVYRIIPERLIMAIEGTHESTQRTEVHK